MTNSTDPLEADLNRFNPELLLSYPRLPEYLIKAGWREPLLPEPDTLIATCRNCGEPIHYVEVRGRWFWHHSTSFGTCRVGVHLGAERTHAEPA